MSRTATIFKCWRFATHEVVLTHPHFGFPTCATCGASVPYHERANYLPENFLLDVFVPARDIFNLNLAPRAAIVGMAIEDGTIWAHFEGWVNGPAQYKDRDARGLWEAGLDHAAGRMVTAYPTIATAHYPQTHLTKVGTYDPRTRQASVSDEVALNRWLA